MSSKAVLPKDILHLPHDDYHPETDRLNFAESEVGLLACLGDRGGCGSACLPGGLPRCFSTSSGAPSSDRSTRPDGCAQGAVHRGSLAEQWGFVEDATSKHVDLWAEWD